MVVQHNLRAMNSNRMLGLTANVQSKSAEKLASGYKINRAADDAAGLSISEKMRKQIRGLSQASLNAADGISAVQTAEGALHEVQDMLQRMNELSVKAANGTMSEDDRSYIQNEIDQLVTEIDRVSETTKFNETYLLKGVEKTETVDKPATVEVSYEADITGEKTLSWIGNGQDQLYATKEGKSVAVTDQNYKDFFEVAEETVVDSVTINKEAKLYDETGAIKSASDVKDILNNGEKVYSDTGKKAMEGVDYDITQKVAVEGRDYTYTAATAGKTVVDGTEFDFDENIVIAGETITGGTASNLAELAEAFNQANVANTTASVAGNKLIIEVASADNGVTGGVAVTAANITVAGAAVNADSVTNGANHTVTLKNATGLYAAGETTDTNTIALAQAATNHKAGTTMYISTTYYDAKDGRTVYDVDGNVMGADEITAEVARAAGGAVQMFTTSPTEAIEGKDYTVESKTNTVISVKDGYEIYDDPANENNQFGAQLTPVNANTFDNYFQVKSDLLMDVDENLVSADKLGDYFDEAGKYLGGLYKYDNLGAKTEVAAEQIDDYVDWKTTDATTEEVVVEEALHFSLQVGADADENNKISIDIESMSAKSLGVAGLKVDGKDSANADAAVDVIAKAIQKISTQRSALGAVQNRLEHTINNLDNVVENTTAAESQIRDTDMATEMVKFSNNNILAQAGQAMLAQANQANQGVLSLLG